MKRFALAIVIAAITMTVPALGADVGVSISIGQPGFYGQIELGSLPRPRVLYTRPIVIERVPRGVVYEPLYLRVPPGHARNWRKYCSRYEACGRPVYFVRDDWYNQVYVPRYREQHRDDRRDNDRRDNDRDYGRDNSDGRDNGNDHNNGRGKGNDRKNR